MIYTEQLRELLKKVEQTRRSRVGVDFPRMTAEERKSVLEQFHPDYNRQGFRELKVGVDKGQRFTVEMADLFEAWSRLRGVILDLTAVEYDVDVLIIGGGGAGAAAALEAQACGAEVLMVTKLRFGDANTMMAQGGIQAADKPNDSPATHYLDVVGGGRFDNIPELARALVIDAPPAIDWLEKMGVMFDKKEDGTMITIHGGGTSRKRMHAARDYTGAEIMRTLRDECYNRGVKIIEFCAAVELILDNLGRAAGAVLLNMETERYQIARAKTVILAAGGSGRLHYRGFPTSNHYGATADGLVMGYRAGAKTIYADSIQYHPTGGAYPPQLFGLLVTEKTRGLGATPLNIRGEQFVYHLETRDVASSAIIRECQERGSGVPLPTGRTAIWLDSPLLEMIHGEGTIERQLPAMLRQYARFGVDIRREPMLIYPTLHYQNGGLLINADAQSTVENLYAAGEAAGGIHGTNRLMGNSLLDIIVFGRRAGRHAAAKSKAAAAPEGLNLSHLDRFHQELKETGVAGDRFSPMLLPRYSHR